jgi:hypothetical protein
MTEATPERALAGLGAFSRKVAIGSVMAIAIAWAGWKVFMATPTATPASTSTSTSTSSVRPERSAAESKGDAPSSPTASAIERRHAEGALQEAVKRFPACPGGDVRRTAWIDGENVVKLSREKADGTQVEEWFDRDGHLREATVRGQAGATKFTRRVVLDERGAATSDATAPAGVVPDAPPPALQREDPSAAFFAGPGCVR